MSASAVVGKRKRRRLSPSEKYEIYVSVLTGQATQREAAERYGVDRSTVVHGVPGRQAGRVGRAGRGGAGPARGESASRRRWRRRRLEIERLRATVTEQAVALHLHEGKARWD